MWNRLLDTRIRMSISRCLVLQDLDGQLHGYVLFKGKHDIGLMILILIATFRPSDSRGCSSIVRKLFEAHYHCPLILV